MIRLALILLLVAGSAQALSCIAPDVARDYRTADAASEVYVVAVGTLQFDASRLPESHARGTDTAPRTDIPARLEGHTLTHRGFTRPLRRDIILRVFCAGPWCAGPISGAVYLAFLRQDGADLVAEASPCGGMLYADPTPQETQTVRSCAAGNCPATPLR